MFIFALATGTAQFPLRFKQFAQNSTDTVCLHRIPKPGNWVKLSILCSDNNFAPDKAYQLSEIQTMKVPQITKTSEALCKVAKIWISISFCLVGCGSKNQSKFCFRKKSVTEIAIAFHVPLFSAQYY